MTTTTDNNTIRKAAILVRSLEPESAAVLLGQLSSAEAKAVRLAIRRLGDVTDEERLDVAAEVQSQNATATDLAAEDATEGVELAITSALDREQPSVEEQVDLSNLPAQLAPALIQQPTASIVQSHPFAAIREIEQADASILAAYLQREDAAVAAIVLSYLPPDRAAAVLDELTFEHRIAAIDRLATLGEGNADALEVLATDLAAWISKRQQEQSRQASRLATIQAILGASSHDSRMEILRQLNQRGSEWIEALKKSPNPTPPPPQPVPISEAPKPIERPLEPAPTEPTAATPIPVQPTSAQPTIGTEPPLPQVVLESLRPSALAEVVKRTPPRQVLLALAGATETLQKRVESLLSAKQAKQLRRHIESLGPTRLRDIEAAQQAMARIAVEVTQPRSTFRPAATSPIN